LKVKSNSYVFFHFLKIFVPALVSVLLFGLCLHFSSWSSSGVNLATDFANYQRDNRYLEFQAKQHARSELFRSASGNGENLFIFGNSHSRDIALVLLANKAISEKYRITRVPIEIKDVTTSLLFTQFGKMQPSVVLICSKYSEQDIKNLAILLDFLRERSIKVGVCLDFPRFPEFGVKGPIEISSYKLGLKGFEIVANSDKINKFLAESKKDSLNLNARIRSIVEGLVDGNIVLIDRSEYICSGNTCLGIGDFGEKFLYDYSHHTVSGAKVFAENLVRVHNLMELLEVD